MAVINKTKGSPCNFFSSFLRQVVRIFFGDFDVLFLVSRRRQRLGDFVAKIMVRAGAEGDPREDPF